MMWIVILSFPKARISPNEVLGRIALKTDVTYIVRYKLVWRINAIKEVY